MYKRECCWEESEANGIPWCFYGHPSPGNQSTQLYFDPVRTKLTSSTFMCCCLLCQSRNCYNLFCVLKQCSSVTYCRNIYCSVAYNALLKEISMQNHSGRSYQGLIQNLIFRLMIATCDTNIDGRKDCGWLGIDENMCEDRGCCWDDHSPEGYPYCYYPEGKYRTLKHWK